MEGYLIQLPACAWETETYNGRGKRRPRNAPKPHAKLLYYTLGEGYLQGFVSPDDMEPVESFQLTSFHVKVDPIYSVHTFKVTVYTKERNPQVTPSKSRADDNSDSSDDDSEDDKTRRSSGDAPSDRDDQCARSLFLFAGGDKALVETWCNKILNWNRYVFGSGGGNDDQELCPEALAQAKANVVAAFHEHNNNGMFSTHCELFVNKHRTSFVDPSTTLETPPTPTATLSATAVDVTKPSDLVENHRPWFMVWKTSSRRISSMSLHN